MHQTSTTRRIAVVASLASSAFLFAALAGCESTPTAGGTEGRGYNSAELRIKQANELIDKGDFDGAVGQVAPVVKDVPGNWEAQFAYGRAMLGKGELEDARRALDRAYRIQPKNEQVVSSLGMCMARQKDVKDAYQLLRSFGKEFRSWRAYLALSHVAEEANDPDTAVTAADEAIKVNEPLPGGRASIDPYMRAADLAFRYGKDAQGVRRLRQAYGINPDYPPIAVELQKRGVKIDATTALPVGP